MNRPSMLLLFVLALVACSGDSAGPTPPEGALQFTAITAGYFQTCGLASDGRAYCWGMNDFGTLGDGTRTTRTRPSAVATSQRFVTLDSGAGHTCALTADGKAYCWGRNDEGQVGDGTFQDREVPVAVATALRFVSISAGHAHSCALTASGEGYCWGDDIRGQLGDGPNTDRTKYPLPVLVHITASLKSIIAGYYQSCALTSAGAAYCWGANDSGQNGDGTTTNRDEPVPVQGNHVFTTVSPGDRFVCGVSSGSVWCWGANRDGELGIPAGEPGVAPIQIGGLSNVNAVFTSSGTSTIASADPYACAIVQSSSVLCWGGKVDPIRAQSTAANALDSDVNAQTIALGPRHVCALSKEKYAYCGGTNGSGELGDGTMADRARMVPVIAPSN